MRNECGTMGWNGWSVSKSTIGSWIGQVLCLLSNSQHGNMISDEDGG